MLKCPGADIVSESTRCLATAHQHNSVGLPQHMKSSKCIESFWRNLAFSRMASGSRSKRSAMGRMRSGTKEPSVSRYATFPAPPLSSMGICTQRGSEVRAHSTCLHICSPHAAQLCRVLVAGNLSPAMCGLYWWRNPVRCAGVFAAVLLPVMCSRRQLMCHFSAAAGKLQCTIVKTSNLQGGPAHAGHACQWMTCTQWEAPGW